MVNKLRGCAVFAGRTRDDILPAILQAAARERL
jgi:hypothetical protein